MLGVEHSVLPRRTKEMDDRRFDNLARGLAGDGWTRRGLARVMTGALVASLFGWGLEPATETYAGGKKKKKKKKKKKCKNGSIKCGKGCVNPQTDALHCGGCGRRCGINVACVNGGCQGGGCPGNQLLCNELCVDPSDNEQHCGGCGLACLDPFTCVDGRCDCADGTRCGNQCVNTETDEEHCGDCETSCEANQICRQGGCDSETACNPACRPDQVCDEGVCDCPSDQFECGGLCRECCVSANCAGNLNGNDCISAPAKPGGLECGCQQSGGGVNIRPCGPEGACSVCCDDDECPEGEFCTAGDPIDGRICACLAGYSECGNRCVDLKTDTSHCGACDFRCCAGATCADVLQEICANGDCCRTIGKFCDKHADCCSGSCNFEFQQCNGPG
jgi:hypothetical protein